MSSYQDREKHRGRAFKGLLDMLVNYFAINLFMNVQHIRTWRGVFSLDRPFNG